MATNLFRGSCTPNLGGVQDYYTKAEINQLLRQPGGPETSFLETDHVWVGDPQEIQRQYLLDPEYFVVSHSTGLVKNLSADRLRNPRAFSLTGVVTGTVSSNLITGFAINTSIATGSITGAMIGTGTITNTNIDPAAEIDVSKLADGTARQLLETAADGTTVQWASNIDVPGTLNVTGNTTFDSNVTISGDLLVLGAGTSVDIQNLSVENKNIELGVVTTPTNITADGGGIILFGSPNKTILWQRATESWSMSENLNLASGRSYRIGNTLVLSATALGSGVQISTDNIPAGTITNADLAGGISDTKLSTIVSANKVAISALDIDGGTDIGTPLADSDLFIVDDGGSGTNRKTVATRITDYVFGKVSGDITTSNTGTAAISTGVIVDSDINASAGISHSKLATMTAGQVLLGNASNVPTSTPITGDISVSSTGVTAISTGVIVDSDINASAAIVDTKLATIATAGKVSNSATTATSANTPNTIVSRDVSGDFTAGTITAAILGNASTATKLSSQRTFTLSGNVTGTVNNDLETGFIISTTIAGGVVTSDMILNGTIVDADISASAEIAVSKLADGAPRQLLETASDGITVQWANNIDVPGTLDVTGIATFDNNVIVQGDLIVNGTETVINTQTLDVEDKNIVVGKVATPSDVTADGGGITLKGTTDKTINWVDATDAWTLSEHVSIASAKEYRIAGTRVLDATSLGSAVVGSSLTSVGTIGTGVWQGTAITDTYLATIATAGKVSNSATTATSANTLNAIVARDGSGNFTAGTITANLTGTASNVTTNANLTGHVTSVGNAAVLGSFTSAQLAAALTDETGSGASVFATSPVLVTPVIGAATGTSLSLTGGSLTVRTAATQDGVILAGRAGGSGTFDVTISPTTLTADRTLTLADSNTTLQGGTMAITGGTLAQFAATTSSQLAGVISDETGSGALVFATSPTLSGTPASSTAAVDTNTTQIATTAYVVGQASATNPLSLGTVAIGTSLRYARQDHVHPTTGLGLTSGTLAQFAATTSSQLAGVISDETGSGALVFATSPSLTTPVIGAATGTSLVTTGAAGLLTRAAATQDGVELIGRAGGTTSLKVTITPGTLTGNRTLTLPDVTGTVITTGDTGSVTSAMIANGTIVDADISASAEIAVSKLADGAARQLLETAADGVTVQWADNIDVPGTLDVTGNAVFDSRVTINGTDITESARDIEESRLIRRNATVSIGTPGTVPFGVGPIIPPGMSLVGIGPDSYNVIDTRSGSVC